GARGGGRGGRGRGGGGRGVAGSSAPSPGSGWTRGASPGRIGGPRSGSAPARSGGEGGKGGAGMGAPFRRAGRRPKGSTSGTDFLARRCQNCGEDDRQHISPPDVGLPFLIRKN